MAANATDAIHGVSIAEGLERYQPRRALRYAEVNVLLLSWEEDDIGVAPEIEDLGRLFRETFGYLTFPYKIPSSSDPGIELALRVTQFIKSCGGEDNLIIVYYGGHGGLNKISKSPCTWSAKNKDGPTLDWSIIQPLLLQASCDVVILLDCCYAGQAARAGAARRVEFLAATDKDQPTPTGSGIWPSFTRILTRVMKEEIERDTFVTLPAVHRILVDAASKLRRQPFYVGLGGDSSAGPIRLARFTSSDGSTDSIQASNIASVPRTLTFRLSLFDVLDSTTAGCILRWLTRDSPTAIRDIRLVDQALTDAKQAQQLGHILLNTRGSSENGIFLAQLPPDAQEKAQKLLGDLQKALSAKIPDDPRPTDINMLINDVENASQTIVTFVSDSLTGLFHDGTAAESADSLQGIEIGDLKNRITMRLHLLRESSPGTPIGVNYQEVAQPGQRFRLGKVLGNPALVEYIADAAADRAAYETIFSQIARTSALLEEPKSPAFRCLKGLGFSSEGIQAASKLGIVYSLPGHLVGRKFEVLSSLITPVKIVPLEVRVKLASQPIDAVLHLHSIGWSHKNIKSSNILVFAEDSLGKEAADLKSSRDWDIKEPYLVAFDCSRPSDSETLGTVDFAVKDNIYRHPDRWGRSARFERHHDFYGLGILLTEVGFWKTLPSMDSRRQNFEHIRDPAKLRDFLLGAVSERLAHLVGTRYANAVRICLEDRDWKAYEDWKCQALVREEVLNQVRSLL